MEHGEDELLPADVVDRLLAGGKPGAGVPAAAGAHPGGVGGAGRVGRVTVAEIETGRKTGSVATLRRLAVALEVAVDDLTA